MRVFKTLSVVLLTTVVWTTAAAQEPKPSPQSVTPGLAEVLASEKLERSVYTNGFFGLRLQVTEGWRVADDESKKRIMERGRELTKPSESVQLADIEKSISNTAVLLTLLQSPEAQPVQGSFILVVEKLPANFSANATGYVTHLKKLLTENSTLSYLLEKDVHPETMNGQPFVALDVFSTSENVRVNQKYACQLRKGFALCFIETYGTDAQLAAINQVVAGFTLK
jgi:hypothetical protein